MEGKEELYLPKIPDTGRKIKNTIARMSKRTGVKRGIIAKKLIEYGINHLDFVFTK